MTMEFRFGAGPIRVNIADMAALKQAVQARFAARQGFALATINLDHLVKLRDGGAFHAAYSAQDFIVADGNPIVWLARLARKKLSLLPGSDLVLPLCDWAAQANVTVGLLGSTADALDAAAGELRLRVPGLEIAAQIAPPMGFDPMSPDADAVLMALREAGVRLCFLALSAPKQEILAARGRALVPEISFACFGAGLDFLAGNQTRAPEWVRKLALEWLWRAATSPLRLGPRYARCAAILPGQAVQALRQRD